MKRNLRKLSRVAGRFGWTAFVALFVALGVQTTLAQSSDVNFPTPLSSNKLNGTIKARDIGDSRLTTHYFVFNGTQGDLFVNVVAKNLDADIDVFAADGLIPLTKMVVASDAQANETGRLIYLRKPEKLILRVQGRSPNDLPATYQISFGGGFATISGQDSPDAPVVDSTVSGEVAVNSVGTILPQQPKKEVARTEPPKTETANAKEPAEAESKPGESDKRKESKASAEKAEVTRPKERKAKRRAEVVVTDAVEPKKEVAEKAPEKKAEKRPRRTAKKEKKPEPPKAETPPPVDPLANVKLVILFKSGEKIEIGMPDLMKFTVDRGQLLVIRKTGSIDRYSMLDVAKVTIE